MGILTRSLGIQNLSLEDPAQPLLPASALQESIGLGKSDAGVLVNEKQAMRLTTAYSCVNIISTDLSSLPFSIFQTLPDGSVREATEHRLYSLLHDEPNSMMSSMTFRGALLAGVLGWGNGYARIRRDRAQRAVSLDLLPSDKTNPALDRQGELIYITTATKDGSQAAIAPEDMIHIAGLTMDGLVGLSPIGTCRQAFGLAIAAERFGALFFGNGARATGVLTHPGELDAEAQENLKKSIREQMTGESALRPLVLEEGMQWSQTTIAPNDAQFLQTRQFQRAEIASLFRVALHLLQDLQRATNNNIEHQSLDHLRYTLRPWAVRLEQEIDRKLLVGTYHSRHDFNEFQRGDFASQTAGYTALRNIGVYSTNDILKKMHENPVPADEGGDTRIVAINMVPLEVLAAQKQLPAPAPEETTDADQGEAITDQLQYRIVASYRRLFRDAIGRITNREKRDSEFAYRALHPIVASMAETILASAGLVPALSDQDQMAVRGWAQTLAGRSADWSLGNKQLSRETATDTYVSLRYLLIGAK